MSQVQRVLRVKPICAVTLSQEMDWEAVETGLVPVMGQVENRSPLFDFNQTAYYRREMGDGLVKRFLSFEGTMHPLDLAELKLKTNALEGTWAAGGQRRVNLDPGYLNGAKMVLASAKDFAHRICIGPGIYADLQYQFRGHSFCFEKWTFPDYQTDLALAFFHQVRSQYMKEGSANDVKDEL